MFSDDTACPGKCSCLWYFTGLLLWQVRDGYCLACACLRMGRMHARQAVPPAHPGRAGGLGGYGLRVRVYSSFNTTLTLCTRDRPFYLPILNVLVGFNLKAATALSHTIVSTSALASSIYGLTHTSPTHPERPLSDIDLVITFVPALLFGVSFGAGTRQVVQGVAGVHAQQEQRLAHPWRGMLWRATLTQPLLGRPY